MNVLFKKALVGLLTLTIAGAVLICAFTGIPLDQGMENMPISNDGSAMHLFHAQGLLLAQITTASSVWAGLLLATVLLVIISVSHSYISAQREARQYFKHNDNIPRLTQTTIRRWLSLFEQSPNILVPA